MKIFDISNIRRMATDRTFDRGKDYFERGRVLSVDRHEKSRSHRAQVRGSGNNTYRVTLSVDAGLLFSNCTCPVSFNCKHGVATAFHLLEQTTPDDSADPQSPPSAPGSWQQWLTKLPIVPTGMPPPLHSGRQYLLYMLVLRDAQVRLELHRGYRKKDGQWSQVSRHSFDNAYLDWNRPSYILDDDVKILELLPRTSNVLPIELTGERGHLALISLLATGRLHFNRNPVERAPPRKLHWEWRQADRKNSAERGYQLTPLLDSGGDCGVDWALIDTSPPWYLDATTGAAGHVLTPLTEPRLQHLLAMPSVRADELTRMSVELRRQLPKEHLPLPLEPQLTRVSQFKPQMTLVIRSSDGNRMPGLELNFDYAGFVVSPNYNRGTAQTADNLTLLERGGSYFEIQRDIQQEQGHFDTLHKLGLYLERSPIADDQPAWLPNATSLSESLAIWSVIEEQELPQLQAQGWILKTADDYHFKVQRADFEIELTDAPNSWFDFSLALPLGNGRTLDTVEVVESWLQQGAPEQLILNIDNQWVNVDTRPLQSIRGLIQDLFTQNKLLNPVRLAPFQLGQLDSFPDLDLRRSPATQKLMGELKSFSGLKSIKPPEGITAQLREYQQSGLNWLCFLQRYGFGGILADDMGLGKTLQALALITHMKEEQKLVAPALAIVPTSLTGNWLQEAARFAPTLRVTLIHGPDRADAFRQISTSDLIVTTYPLLLRDLKTYGGQHFSLLVLDEAQAIKNPRTKIADCVRAINADCRICLTGTPLENHLGELWAIMDFCLPGLLGGRKSFTDWFRNPIEKEANTLVQGELARKVSPFMVRRTKGEVAQELPPKTEMVQFVELNGKQRALYESIRISMEKRIRDLVAAQGMARSHIQFLDALLKLRQACIDPRLVKLPSAAGVNESAKMDWLEETLPQLIEEGRSILIFSQFTQALDLIEQQLQSNGQSYTKLTGQTRKRQEAIDRFQSGEVRIFLISLKAGGSGLNLTAADVVIHIDPWWNPAVENQATDRAHRIGQDKPVFVYKLVAAGTVEERITQMQQHKQALADSLFDATQTASLPRSGDDILALLAQ